jgi:hypothetical protein
LYFRRTDIWNATRLNGQLIDALYPSRQLETISTKRPSNLDHSGHNDPKSLRSLLPKAIMIFKLPNICPVFTVFFVRTFAVVSASMLEEQNVGLRGKRLGARRRNDDRKSEVSLAWFDTQSCKETSANSQKFAFKCAGVVDLSRSTCQRL